MLRMDVDRRVVSSHLIIRVEITEAVVLVCPSEVLGHNLGALFFSCHLGVAVWLVRYRFGGGWLISVVAAGDGAPSWRVGGTTVWRVAVS